MKRKEITAENALARLEALCARSEHCSYEMETKLRMWGITGKDAEMVMRRLIEGRFVDDGRFAKAFARDKIRFGGYGRMKIRMLLGAKRIGRDLIDEAIGEIEDGEYRERLEHIVEARARRMDDADSYEGRTRLFRYAAQRGFESALISEVIKEMARRRRAGG